MIKKTIQPYSRFNPEPKRPDFLEQMNLKPGFSGQSVTKLNKYSGLYFDGVGDYVTTLLFYNITDPITISGWVVFKNVTSAQRIFNFADDGSGVRTTISLTSASKLSFRLRGGSFATGTTSLQSGIPYMLTMTYNGTSGIGYINNNIEISSISIGSLSGLKAFNVGYDSVTLLQYLNGTIDEVKIWNRALSASELLQLYQKLEPLLDPTGSCVLHHDYKRGHAKDLSGHGNNGTVYDATYM